MLLIRKFNCFFLNSFLRIRFKIIKCFYRLSLSSTLNFLYFFQQFVFVPEKRQTFLLFFPDEQHSSLVASSELWSAKFSIFFIMFRSKRHVFSSLLQRKKTYFPYQTNSVLRSIKGSLRISFSIQFITFQCNIVSLNFSRVWKRLDAAKWKIESSSTMSFLFESPLFMKILKTASCWVVS